MLGPDGVRQLDAGHLGHDGIGQQEVDVAGVTAT
jgi:hypothetical protein